MATQSVESRGIYHGLPIYSDKIKGLTAIITGANGISGYHMLKVLAEAPERWTKIYCLSRRPPAVSGGLPSNAEHIPLDFLKSPEEIASALKEKGVKADYIFFFSYIQVEPKEGQGLWSDAVEMSRVNKLLLDNFLGALTKASIKPKRIMLQTGAKHYGIHLGPTKLPSKEGDPRTEFEPNFYYPQVDSLVKYCAENSIGWSEVRPSFILGAVPDAAMNLVFSLGIYGAVCKHLNQPLEWPSGLEAWSTLQDQSSAKLNAYLEEWTVLAEHAKDQAFNACDGSSFTWERLWPMLADWYGIEYKRPDVNAKYQEMETGYDPPPKGYGPKAKVKVRFTLAEWGKQPKVQQAWRELAEKHSLHYKDIPEPDRVLAFTDAALLGAATVQFSTDKARKMGFFGMVDSSECILEVLNDFAKLKLIPPVPNPDYGAGGAF